MTQYGLKSERVSPVDCQFITSPIIAFIFIFLTGHKISNDVSIPFNHVEFTDFNPDHLVLCSEQQQQRQNKTKHGKFISAFSSLIFPVNICS